MTRLQFVQYVARVVMAVFGLSHTYNTKVGNDFIRGVSGGERKRVSIAEMVLSASPFSAWDNRYEKAPMIEVDLRLIGIVLEDLTLPQPTNSSSLFA